MKKLWSTDDIGGLIEEARTWIGVPFRHQGRSRAGVDCVGILGICAQARGLAIDLPTDYEIQVDPGRLKSYLKEHLDEIAISTAMPGDILQIRFVGRSTHLVLKTNLGILHASTEFGKVTEHGYDESWKRRTTAAFRLPRRPVIDE